MKETRFIAQNKEKWLESEMLLKDPEKDPEKLNNLFTQVVDDLSYSRTYYPNRTVRVYLNKIAREYFSLIYSHQNEKKNRFKSFWLDELPQIVFSSRKQILISFLVFILSACIGIFSSYKDPQFTSTILGKSYVDMTKENIKNGDPMAVYKKGHQVDMFLGITMNNLFVAFRTYVFGIFLSIGTLAILLYNGIMIGCFQYFFIERGLFTESALTIWLHGTLEISSIILSGGAGLILGSGLIFPGSYSRLQAFQISAMRSLKLMLGIAPILVIAGIIESFLTRYTDVPDALRLFLILLSASFIIGYFVIYPWLKHKTGFDSPLVEVRLQPSVVEPVNYARIKNNAEIIKDTFQFYKRNGNELLRWVAPVTLFMTLSNIFLNYQAGPMRLEIGWYSIINELFFALQTPMPGFILINTIGSGLIIYAVLQIMEVEFSKSRIKSFNLKSCIQTLVIISIIYSLLYSIEGVGAFLIGLSFVIILLAIFTQHLHKLNFLSAIVKSVALSVANFSQVISLQFILLIISLSVLIILTAPIMYIHTSVIQWNFAKTDAWAIDIITFIQVYLKIFGFNMILPLFVSSSAFLYFTLEEIVNADHLKKSIEQVGSKLSMNSRR